MEEFFNNYIKSAVIVGVSISLTSGILRFITKINIGSGSNIESMGKIFLLVTATGSIIKYTSFKLHGKKMKDPPDLN